MGKQPNSHSKRKLSQDTFLELIRADLLEHITKEMGGRVSGDNITKIICPGCEKPEAWTKVADPSTIHCNRKNNCGASTHAKTFAPHLWGNWSERFPTTKEDTHTALPGSTYGPVGWIPASSPLSRVTGRKMVGSELP